MASPCWRLASYWTWTWAGKLLFPHGREVAFPLIFYVTVPALLFRSKLSFHTSFIFTQSSLFSPKLLLQEIRSSFHLLCLFYIEKEKVPNAYLSLHSPTHPHIHTASHPAIQPSTHVLNQRFQSRILYLPMVIWNLRYSFKTFFLFFKNIVKKNTVAVTSSIYSSPPPKIKSLIYSPFLKEHLSNSTLFLIISQVNGQMNFLYYIRIQL